VSSFVYGSDFLGASKIKLRYLEYVFRYSDSIVCDSSTVLYHLKKDYSRYKDKIECCFFGSIIIDKLLEKNDISFKHRIETNKKILMCGYNGSLQQQHIKIIKSLHNIARQFFWIVPMTYAGTEEYKNEIKECLESYKLEYLILDTFLTEEAWINYLYMTDIFIHMQTTDAFSAALSEQLLLGHIVINGEWLPYKDFDDNNVFYFKSNFNKLELDVSSILNNYESYVPELKNNRGRIEKIKGLKYCISNYWIPYFNRILGIASPDEY